jgi:ABC-type glycerol-3-phosphate transport system substrate-binding protein
MRKSTLGILAGIGLMLTSSTAVLAQELTIFWAEWDPANYLQELVNEYEAETGVKVTVETTPWSDFQTKAFTEFNAQGSAYDMVVGDSQWLGAGATGGHYVDLTDFFTENKVAELMAPATVKFYAEYPGNSGKYWAIPLEGDAVGWSYRKDWFEDPAEKEAFKAKYGYDLAVPPSTPTTPTTPWPWASRMPCSPTAANWATWRPTRSTASSTAPRPSPRSTPTRSSMASPLRAGPRPSSSRTTRPSPRAWRR